MSKRYSIAVLILVSLIILGVRLATPVGNPVSWDFYGYYLYLPATLKYNDPGLEDRSWIEANNKKYNSTPYFYQLYQNQKTGKTLTKYPVGQAISYLPFYLAADIYASHTDKYPADGFSYPYQLMMVVAGLFYSLLGLILMFLLLTRFFTDKIAALTLLIITMGTNYFWMAAYNGTLIHNVQLVWITAFLIFTIKWHDQQKKKYAFLLGILYGLAVITRPTAILLILLPVFWQTRSLSQAKEKIIHICKKQYTHLILLFAGFMLLAFWQMLYWKYASGSWISYTYQNPGEGFELHWPYTLKFLFSFRKGWLIYTPVMIFALIGIYTLKKNRRDLFLPILIFSVAYIWLMSSWSCWWYAASFSQRSLIQAYPVFALALGSFLIFIQNKKIKIPALILIFLFSAVNLFYTWQYRKGILHQSRMTTAYYCEVFGKIRKPEGADKLLLLDRKKDPKLIIDEYNLEGPKTLALYDFEQDEYDNRDPGVSWSGKYSVKLDSSNSFSPKYTISYRDLTHKDFAVIKVSAMIYPTDSISDRNLLIACMFKHKGAAYKYRTSEEYSTDKFYLPGKWQNIEYYYLTPDPRRKGNELETYIWLRKNISVFVDNFEVEFFEPGNQNED